MRLFILVLSLFLILIPINNGKCQTNVKLDSFFKRQQLLDSRQDSAIKTALESKKNYEIKESLFSNELTILTAIFSTIVAISIFVIGFLIPKLNDEKHRGEINRLLAEFKTIRDEIKESREETARVNSLHEFNNSKIMFFSCCDNNNKGGELLWALRHCKDNYNLYKKSNDEDIMFYIRRALESVGMITSDPSLKEFVDEVNDLTAFLIESYTIEGLKEKLISIKEQYNRIAWS